MLWAWERPEDLRFLAAGRIGVAFLAGTVRLAGSRCDVRPRMQPLVVDPATTLVAVVRIESDRRRRPRLTNGQRSTATDAIVRAAGLPRVRALQVDFDAAVSERAFYRSLLAEVRRLLPAGVGLSITALASWCLDDPWIAGLPVDEAVPMLFRMGADHASVLRRLAAGEDFRLPMCRGSLGLSTDEPIELLPAGRRRWVFSPTSWPESTARAARVLGSDESRKGKP
jgi:hypothetical protein